MGKKKILIVEDEGVVALQIKSVLENLGYEVIDILSSGEETLAKIKQLCPDLVLMDIRLDGEINGIEATRRLRNQHNLPVIYLTAHMEESTIADAKTTEPYGYILKPFGVNDLRITVEMALYKHSMDMEKEKLTKELQAALANVKLLSGMLPICASCKKIRDDTGYWEQIEAYISDHSEAEFSHGLCPDCEKKAYEELKTFLDEEKRKGQ